MPVNENTGPKINAGPLDELLAYSRVERGFPYKYYTARLPDNCGTATAEIYKDIDYNAKFLTTAFLANVAVLSLVVFVISEAGQYATRRNKK